MKNKTQDRDRVHHVRWQGSCREPQNVDYWVLFTLSSPRKISWGPRRICEQSAGRVCHAPKSVLQRLGEPPRCCRASAGAFCTAYIIFKNSAWYGRRRRRYIWSDTWTHLKINGGRSPHKARHNSGALTIQLIFCFFLLILSFNVDCFPLFFWRILFPSILYGIFNQALCSIFVEARIFVSSHFLVDFFDFFGSLFRLVVRLLLHALSFYGFLCCMRVRRAAVP